MKLLLKLFVTVVLIIVLLRRVDVSATISAISSAHVGYIMVGYMLIIMSVIIKTLRWHILLRHIASHNYAFKTILVASFRSLFYGQFLPSSVGADITKPFLLPSPRPSMKAITISLLWDRALGFICLVPILASSLMIVDVPVSFELNAVSGTLVIVLSIIVSYVGTQYFYHRLHKHNIILPFALSLLSQLIMCLSVWIITLAFIPINLSIFLFAVPLFQIVSAIPITINGIGLRENAFISILGMFAISQEISLASSLVTYIGMILIGAIGGVTLIPSLLQNEKTKKLRLSQSLGKS